jgi:predicted AAA+ superfamily ATPase
MIFQRTLQPIIAKQLFKGKMIVLLGPRQSGKTTLSKELIKPFADKGAYFDCQLSEVRRHFVLGEPDQLLPLIGNKKIVVFDEAQTIQDIGSILKIFFDTYPSIQIIATGSSSFDLANKIKEPMTGRAYEFTLLPLSTKEIASVKIINESILHETMLYGSYPAVVAATTKEDKLLAIRSIATNYLYKDVFTFEAIRNPKAFEDLLRALALQIGSLVSINELAQTLGITRTTINRYLRLLEQAFVIKRLYGFSNNPRNELKKACKIFFLDTGVRNVLVDIISPLNNRIDRGTIFENFFITERMKIGATETFPPEIMFWRSRAGEEIDVIERSGPHITAFECKWTKQPVIFKKFLKAYPSAITSVVSPSNFWL